MITEINGTDFSNVYRLSLPQSLSLIILKLNEIIREHNKKTNKDNSVQRSIIQSFLGHDKILDTNPNIRLSKDIWI